MGELRTGAAVIVAAGLLAKYAVLVGQADKGAVTHAGSAEWPEG